MAKFAKIKPNFWRRKDLRGIGQLSKLLAIYLLTNENIRMLGIYRLPLHTIMTELNIEPCQLETALNELIARNFCLYDKEEEVVWVSDMAFTQVADNPNEKQLKGIQNELKGLADADYPFLSEFIQKYTDVFELSVEWLLECSLRSLL